MACMSGQTSLGIPQRVGCSWRSAFFLLMITLLSGRRVIGKAHSLIEIVSKYLPQGAHGRRINNLSLPLDGEGSGGGEIGARGLHRRANDERAWLARLWPLTRSVECIHSHEIGGSDAYDN